MSGRDVTAIVDALETCTTVLRQKFIEGIVDEWSYDLVSATLGSLELGLRWLHDRIDEDKGRTLWLYLRHR